MANGTSRPNPRRRRRKCPEGGAVGVPITYVLPGPDSINAARRGGVFIGGCIVSGGDLTHHYPNGHKGRDG